MSVNADTVREMAQLARLSIPDEQVEDVAADMTATLNFMGAITAWEGVPAPAGPPTQRRPDRVHPAGRQAVMTGPHVGESGEVVVPPIKGAS